MKALLDHALLRILSLPGSDRETWADFLGVALRRGIQLHAPVHAMLELAGDFPDAPAGGVGLREFSGDLTGLVERILPLYSADFQRGLNLAEAHKLPVPLGLTAAVALNNEIDLVFSPADEYDRIPGLRRATPTKNDFVDT